MRIRIITPAPPRSRKGNRISALRWAGLLRELGHRVWIQQGYEGECADVVIVMHALKSAVAAAEFRTSCKAFKLVLLLTGTDVYGDIHTSPVARDALAAADRLVVLQPLALDQLPARHRRRAHVIVQSATAPRAAVPRARGCQVCVVGHLRDVKDPMLAAKASRLLPGESKIRVVHAGSILEAKYERLTRAENTANPRYRYAGELPRGRVMRLLAASRALVLSSCSEGGANVISEAAVCGTPVLATRIDGNVGLLGADYPGYFECGDAAALAALMLRLEHDLAFERDLQRRMRALAPQFKPAREKQALRKLLASL